MLFEGLLLGGDHVVKCCCEFFEGAGEVFEGIGDGCEHFGVLCFGFGEGLDDCFFVGVSHDFPL